MKQAARRGLGWLVAGTRPIRRRIVKIYHQPQPRVVPLDRLLLGSEAGVRAARFARMTDNPLWPSTPVSRFPHTKLLRQYEEIGERLFEPEIIKETDYYKNALLKIDITGSSFDAKSPEQIPDLIRRFINCYLGVDQSHLPRQEGQSEPGSLIHVRPVMHSDCYQIMDGHHRAAIAHMRGQRDVRVLVIPDPDLTPLQSLLLDVLWTGVGNALYQPVQSPELEQWVLFRRCEDRFAKMRRFLEDNGLMPPAARTYVDLGASYGWFVAQMAQLGFSAQGVERDPFAVAVGKLAYGLGASNFHRSDCTRFLKSETGTYDVVSCFSVLHHYALGKGDVSAEELIRLIDKITGRVLFLDTGQNHEAWFKDSLSEWDVDYIEAWLRKHTSFTTIVRLGVDEDAVPPFQDNYGRMLFACLR